jgi:hypothetical protein
MAWRTITGGHVHASPGHVRISAGKSGVAIHSARTPSASARRSKCRSWCRMSSLDRCAATALDRRDAHHPKARALLLRLISDGIALHLSVINYAEALVKPAENPTTLQQAIEAIVTLGVHLHSPDAGIARDAAGPDRRGRSGPALLSCRDGTPNRNARSVPDRAIGPHSRIARASAGRANNTVTEAAGSPTGAPMRRPSDRRR